MSLLDCLTALYSSRESYFKIIVFFVAYLSELIADPNKKKYVVLTLDTTNVVACQKSV